MAEDIELLLLRVIELSGATIPVVAVEHKPKLVALLTSAENARPLVDKLKITKNDDLRRDLIAHLEPTVRQLDQINVGTIDFNKLQPVLDNTTRYLAALPGKPGLGPD